MDKNKSVQEIEIDVCVVTYKRNPGLVKLVESLMLQDLVGLNLSFRIIVVDNDKDGGARSAVLDLEKKFEISIFYCIEPSKGVANARNRAIEEVSADYFAFIDDDEYASKNWLKNMWEMLSRNNADVVFGPVSGVFENKPPKWCLNHPCFVRPNRENGVRCTHGASGNVLVKKESIIFNGELQKFDLKYSLTGGEDTEYFYRLNKNNVKMIWCKDAEVFETIPESRAKLAWVVRRAYRGGQCYYKIFKSHQGFLSRALSHTYKIIQLFFGLLLLPVSLLLGNGRFEKLLCRIAGAVGQLSSVFGEKFTYQEYK